MGRKRQSLEAIDQLFAEVARKRVPKQDELNDLIRAAHAGDQDALNDVVKSQVRLLRKELAGKRNRGMEEEDMLQEAMQIVAKAAETFDPERGVLFASYYMQNVRSKWTRMSGQRHALNIPGNMMSHAAATFSARKRLREKGVPKATVEEVLDEVRLNRKQIALTPERLAEVEKWGATGNASSCSLDDPVGDGTVSRGSRIASGAPAFGEQFDVEADEAVVSRALARLRSRDADVMRYRYGLDGLRELTLEEIGSELGITRERVRQLEKRATRELTTGPDAEALREAMASMAARRN